MSNKSSSSSVSGGSSANNTVSSAAKMGFFAISSIVVGGQVGVGVLSLPTYIASYGSIGIFGWVAAASGAILLALIFSQLAKHISKAGGPHVYVEAAFGRAAGFFIGWGYWLVAWTSNIAVIMAAVSYLTPITGQLSAVNSLVFEIAIVVVLTIINIYGPSLVGKVEVVLTTLKCLPLIIIPIGGLIYFNIDNFYPINAKNLTIPEITNQTALIVFWGFLGLESATTNAGVVHNPEKTIPRAVMFGTIIVAILYILNCIGVMSLVSQDVLVNSRAPYVEAAKKIFGNDVNIYASVIISLACIGTLNAWILTSGQIAQAAARDGLFPDSWSKLNKYGSPYISLLISLIGTIIILIATLSDDLIEQIKVVIDISVTAFFFVYCACMLAYFKLYARTSPIYAFLSILATIFCLWMIFSASILNMIVSMGVLLSGFPVYLYQSKRLSFRASS